MKTKLILTLHDLLAAQGKTIPDVIAAGLDVVFCGINPGLYSAAAGHHFARPGNRFWKALHMAGFTPRLFSPYEDADLIEFSIGITNIVPRATRAATELTRAELIAGRRGLESKIGRYEPCFLAILGLGAYRKAFEVPKAEVGLQPDVMGTTRVWVLPNPSGLNANYQISHLVPLFAQLLKAIRKQR